MAFLNYANMQHLQWMHRNPPNRANPPNPIIETAGSFEYDPPTPGSEATTLQGGPVEAISRLGQRADEDSAVISCQSPRVNGRKREPHLAVCFIEDALMKSPSWGCCARRPRATDVKPSASVTANTEGTRRVASSSALTCNLFLSGHCRDSCPGFPQLKHGR